MLKRFFLLVAAMLPLGGCVDDDLAKCQYEAQKAFPMTTLVRSTDMGRMIIACMNSKGYEFYIYSDECHISFETEASPACYRWR
jgi:hypothetical protein